VDPLINLQNTHSPTSSAEVKECVELYFQSQYVFMEWYLVKHRDNFALPYLTPTPN